MNQKHRVLQRGGSERDAEQRKVRGGWFDGFILGWSGIHDVKTPHHSEFPSRAAREQRNRKFCTPCECVCGWNSPSSIYALLVAACWKSKKSFIHNAILLCMDHFLSFVVFVPYCCAFVFIHFPSSPSSYAHVLICMLIVHGKLYFSLRRHKSHSTKTSQNNGKRALRDACWIKKKKNSIFPLCYFSILQKVCKSTKKLRWSLSCCCLIHKPVYLLTYGYVAHSFLSIMPGKCSRNNEKGEHM